ncbi:cysteine desulfurase/selenocysteine lyase [Bradyrhizobium sp. USDA 326]|uniref:aminotransferase class V-fold PLP-dependent enzyme n=1 Tax=unclassified Bradyrhizobium TaxID=2631580 RepID=UPI003513E322
MTNAAAPLFDLSELDLRRNVVHVCAGGETPPLTRHALSFAAYLRDKGNGMPGRVSQNDVLERVRARLGKLWHIDSDEIGVVSNVAEGISMVFESMVWQDGDNVCFDASEYPSVVAPFVLAGAKVPEIRFADGTGPDRILQKVNSRTRLIAVSYVSYLNGERFDLVRLRAKADEVGAILIVDYSQAAGYLPIEASIADFAFSACYKWLLGVTGCAVAYWNRNRQPGWHPATGGWHSLASGSRLDYTNGLTLRQDALRFSRGNPSHASLYVLDGALAFLAGYDAHAIQNHVQTLTVDLHDRLSAAGIAASTPRDTNRHGASICIDGDFDQSVVDNLHRRGVYIWGGRGRLRISFHGFNQRAELDTIMRELLDELAKTGQQ